MTIRSSRELIELELSSCIQKLAYLRGGGMSLRSFPESERAVIEAFGLSCCRLMAVELARQRGADPFTPDGDYEPNPLDEDTSPGFRRKKE